MATRKFRYRTLVKNGDGGAYLNAKTIADHIGAKPGDEVLIRFNPDRTATVKMPKMARRAS